jgi:hypothetical protein
MSQGCCQYPGCCNPAKGRGKWCSNNCKSKASYHRRKSNNRLSQRLGSYADISTVRRYSDEAADCLIQIRDVAGADIGDIALDAVWSLLVLFKVDLTPEKLQ